MPLPIGAPGEESVISNVSPNYRVGNLNLDLDGKKIIHKEMIQLSFESKIMTTLLT